MAWWDELPEAVTRLIRTRTIAEYATVSAAGVPIDTPTFCFASADLATIDIGTGLAYPAKAERARRNPKTGLLFEGSDAEPVVSMAGMASVRDADLQGNLERYAAETILTPNLNPESVPWELSRERVWYLTRVIVCIAPVHILWWPNRAAMAQPPGEWSAPEGSIFPTSDPAPAARPSVVPEWGAPDWRELAAVALAGGWPSHLTLLDPDGFPLPIRVQSCERHAQGFRLLVPRGAPWRAGKATLSFGGKEIFVGDATIDGEAMLLRVERALPILPTMANPTDPGEAARVRLRQRLDEELARRGQPMPIVSDQPPAPTPGARIRAGLDRI